MKTVKDTMPNEPGKDEGYLHKALSHEIRRKIIELIGENDSLSYSELSKLVHSEPGTLYHHLNFLKPLIVQGDDKLYRLTEYGKMAYDLLKKSRAYTNMAFSLRTDPKYIRCISLTFLALKINKSPLNYVLAAPLLIGLIGLIMWFVGLTPRVLFYTPGTYEVYMDIGLMFASWITVFASTEIFFRVIGEKEGTLQNLIGSAFAFIPFISFALIYYGLTSLGIYVNPIHSLLGLIILILHQFWYVAVESRVLHYAKKVPLDKAIIAALLPYYLSFVCILLVVL